VRILALDLGISTGWAALLDGGAVESGTQVHDLRRGESRGMRYLRFRAWLGGVLDQVRPDVVAFEQAHHRGGPATEIGVGLSTRVMESCAERGIEYTSVHTGTLKKHATGKGSANKDAMVQAARDRWHIVPETDDQADALCVLAWAMDELGVGEDRR